VENIPSFKTHIKKILSYANIYLKRVDSIKHLSNNSSCYTIRKFDEIDPNSVNKLKLNYINVSIESLTQSQSKIIDKSENKCQSLSPNDTHSSQYNIKAQNFVENVAHFKLLRDGKILINFVDKVRLILDEKSVYFYFEAQRKKSDSYCLVYLPDNSEHDVNLSDKNNSFFGQYLGYLEQWIKWLIDSNEIKPKLVKNIEISQTVKKNEEPLDKNTLQSHLNKLKYFNFSIEQSSNENDELNSINNQNRTLNNSTSGNDISLLTLNSLLRENSKFLQQISK
jgi:hypothetical protein